MWKCKENVTRDKQYRMTGCTVNAENTIIIKRDTQRYKRDTNEKR